MTEKLEEKFVITRIELEDPMNGLDIAVDRRHDSHAVECVNNSKFPKNKYEISAYPGPAVVGDHRPEHLPYHVHVTGDKIDKEIRVNMEKLVEMDGYFIPKNLLEHLTEYKEHYLTAAKEVYQTGHTNIHRIKRGQKPIKVN